MAKTRIPEILTQYQDELLADWVRIQLAAPNRRLDLVSEQELRRESQEFLDSVCQAVRDGDLGDVSASSWNRVREMLAGLSRSRARLGFTPAETAMFVFSFKEPLFVRLRAELHGDPHALADEIRAATTWLDNLGLYATEVYQKGREEVIRRQQAELLELSTPVVRLWQGILALPLIGTLDSARTQVVMENLLREIVETGSSIAIIDITGVPTVDTLVAQHLLKTVAAARLMGADCFISGIRPAIAQTIVQLGVGLGDVITKASLADAFRLALQRLNLMVVQADHRS